MISIDGACEILGLAQENGIQVFLDGGWGVDALIGRQTRDHNDIDLFVHKSSYGDLVDALKARGFQERAAEYTSADHTLWQDGLGRIVDLHVFELGSDGSILYDGGSFDADTFDGRGSIGSFEVSCIGPARQAAFHTGYEPDENDVHDVKLLCDTFNIPIPAEYKSLICKDKS